ncbi:hypothetical protein [Tsukamurella pseudospumae]|uniref:Uncharacterized protein n=1 Tax=Tsukamurella pseudospumae TaxID=239498 RepID=A0A138A3X0_9ACTN|nr:hypothetical protein [Tsukamurella pseudospumae]KXP05130.1 hypothetical protein AXK60_13320 [Tsukamurella pseudospumae]
MSTSLTVALLAVLTTVGLVGSVVSDGAASLVWAVTTVAVAGLLAWRLRSAPPGMGLVAAFITGILVVSAGLPVAIVMTEGDAGPGSRASAADETIDPSTEVQRVLAKAEEIQPGATKTLRQITISTYWTQMRYLDLARGEEVWFQFSRSGGSHEWNSPSRSTTSYRADAAFSAADIAGLDLTAASTKVDAAIAALGIERKPSTSDKIEIARRSSDKKLVATFGRSSVEFETDHVGNLPDNLALAKVDGLLPVAERLLRDNGFTPDQSVLDDLEYRVFATNASSVGSGKGTVEITVRGAGKYGTLKETVGKFPEVRLSPSTYTPDDAFPLRAITTAAIEKARSDVEQRFSVPPIDAHALGLHVDTDTRTSSRAVPPPILQVGLGPNSDHRAYYRIDGSYLRAD